MAHIRPTFSGPGKLRDYEGHYGGICASLTNFLPYSNRSDPALNHNPKMIG